MSTALGHKRVLSLQATPFLPVCIPMNDVLRERLSGMRFAFAASELLPIFFVWYDLTSPADLNDSIRLSLSHASRARLLVPLVSNEFECVHG